MKISGRLLTGVVGMMGLFAQAAVSADTKLSLVIGSKEFEQLQQAITVSAPEGLFLQWSTDAPGAVGGTWQVTSGNSPTVLAQGTVPLSTIVGRVNRFPIPASAFLAPTPPAVPKAYSITIRATDAKSKPVGTASAAVIVTQAPSAPPPKIIISTINFPAVKLLRYFAVTSSFQDGSLSMLVSNPGDKPTAAVVLLSFDRNNLVESNLISIPSLKANASMTVALKLSAHLPPPPSALFDPFELRQKWAQSMHDKGVDLDALLDWRQAEFKHVFMYKGKTDSCRDGLKNGDETVTDGGGSCGCSFGRELNAAEWRNVYGFQFGNTTQFKDMVGDYDLGDLQSLYGDCSVFISCFPPILIPDPIVAVYMGVLDEAVKDGRCFGFALAALEFNKGDQSLLFYPSVTSNQPNSSAGPPCDTWHLRGIELSNGNNVSPELARLIKRQHALQLSAESISCFLGARFANFSGFFRNKLNDLPAVVSITEGGAGHTLLAHHVVDRDDGGFDVLCYDCNVPFDPVNENTADKNKTALLQSKITVNGDGTYSFDDKHHVSHKGKAGSDLTYFPYSTFQERHLPSLVDINNATILGSVSGAAFVAQVTDDAGRALFLAGGAINENPQTRIRAYPFTPMNGIGGGGPVRYIVMDAKEKFTHSISSTGPYQVRFIGPGYAVHIDQIAGKGGQTDHVTVDAKAAAFAISTTAASKEVHGKLLARAADKSTRVAAIRVTLAPKSPVRLEFDPQREALVYRHFGAASHLALELSSSANHTVTFTAKPVSVEDGDVLTIKPNWRQLHLTPGTLRVVKRSGTVTDTPLR
jgi:hypothetical protein